MASTLLSLRWLNYVCHPHCECGWTGEPTMSTKAAKVLHKRHLREDCPIGDRNAGH